MRNEDAMRRLAESMMRKPSRRWSLLGALLVIALVSCVRPPEKVTRLQFAVFGSIEQMKIEQAIVTEFERRNPDIKVDLLRVGARYAEKITAAIVGRTAPDVMMMSVEFYYDWALRGVLVDLTAELDALHAADPLMPVPLRATTFRGRAYGLPINVHAPCLFYNKDLLRRAGVELPAGGVTWEWLEEVAPWLARRTGNPGAPADFLMVSPDGLLLLTAFGGQCFDDPAQPTKVVVDSEPVRRAMDYVQRMGRAGAFIRGAEAADPSNPQLAVQLFRDQRMVFHLNGRWEVPNIAGRVSFDWGVLPIPQVAETGRSFHYGTFIGVSAQSPHREAARRLARFYASRPAAEIAMTGGRTVPVARSLAFSPEFEALAPLGVNRTFADTMEADRSVQMLYTPGMQEARRIFYSRYEQLTSEQAPSVDAVLALLEQDLARWLERQERKGLL
jgi:ABC-type glycerol-3-phosphate transport system substrate-binding protein